jgi:hypothetical protein
VSVNDEETLSHLQSLAERLSETILHEFELGAVVLKLHLGTHAVVCCVTSKERGNEQLDSIVLGEVAAMSKYAEENHNGREISGETHLLQPDGTFIVARSGEGKTGQT